MSGPVGERSSLRMFGLSSLRRHWKLVSMVGALFLVLGLVVAALRPASCTASTQLLVYVRELQPGPEPVISAGRADLTQVENEIEIIRSRGLLAKVVRLLKLYDDSEFTPLATPFQVVRDWVFRVPKATFEESRIRQDIAVESLLKRLSVKRIGTSHTVLVSVRTSDAHKSARIANAIGETVLQAPVSAEPEGSRSPLLRERLKGLGLNTYVITAADAPGRPDGPRKILIILGATIVGLAIGSVLALLLDFRDRTVRTAAQLAYLGLECIGIIPQQRHRDAMNAGGAGSGHRPVGREELRSNPMLVQTLHRATVAIDAAKLRTIGVTSAVSREGAKSIAKHLAQTAVCCGHNVLLVWAGRNELSRSLQGEDWFRPAEPFGEQWLRGSIARDERNGLDILDVDNLDHIDGTTAWWMHCDQDRLSKYDLIVVCLPPLELGAEFRAAAQNLDGILLVLKWGSTEFERVERAIAVSGAAPSEFIGAVLNKVDERMIGKFGDRFWKVESALVAQRRPFEFSLPAEQAIG